MNQLTIIGNLVRDPETRTTADKKTVCSFTVAVNRRNNEADFFRVSAWNALGENCGKYLAKGRKVCVVGPINSRTYESDWQQKTAWEVTARDVEFLNGVIVQNDQGTELPWNDC